VPDVLAVFEKAREPPIPDCPSCKSRLTAYHDCSVKKYTTLGVKWCKKITLRCQRCGIFFGYSKFGNKTSGFQFYDVTRKLMTVFLWREKLWNGKVV